MSTLSKILERILKDRLQKFIDEKGIIPQQQHGFRKGFSTTTQLHRVTNHIKDALQSSLSTGMVLVDIEKAFDRVWLNGLVYKLIKYNVPHYLIRIIFSFINDRTYQVKVGKKLSPAQPIPFGVPQGAVLSPTLYCIYTADAPKLNDCEVSFFADDTAFYKSSRFCKTIEKSLRNAIRRYQGYFRRWKVKLNIDKTQAIFFTKRISKQIPTTTLKLGSEEVNWCDTAKYLGLLMDKRLTLRKHTNYAANKCHVATRILYSLLNKRSKLYSASKSLLYKVGIRPTMLYAAPILQQAAKTIVQKLQVAQNKVLRLATNSKWRTRIATIHELAQADTVPDYINRLTATFLANNGDRV